MDPFDNIRSALGLTSPSPGDGSVNSPVYSVFQQHESTGSPILDQMNAVAKKAQQDMDYGEYAEMSRIIQLPLTFEPDAGELEHLNRRHLLATAFANGFRLFPVQAQAIKEYEETGGGFFPIGVGFGKTLTAYRIAGLGLGKGIRKAVYMLPPNVYTQTVLTQLKFARQHIPMQYAIHKMGQLSAQRRRNIAMSDKPGLYILPYSLLSTKDSEDLLQAIDPGLMIFDECHALRNRQAARTKRVMRYVTENGPEVICLSGTITSKGVKDYWHLISAALKAHSPLPLSNSLAIAWAAILDADAEEQGAATGPLQPLIQWAHGHFPDKKVTFDRTGFRAAYKLRLMTCPGVVSSGDAEIGVSLSIQNQPVQNFDQYDNYPVLKKLIEDVTDQWVTPNGDEIEHAIHTWKWLYELSAGFYNELTWPDAEVFAERKNIGVDRATEILDKARYHHGLQQEYHKLLRAWLNDHHVQGCDTPMLVGQSMYQHGDKYVTSELYRAWCEMRAADFEDRPERDSRAVRVCAFKVNDACLWANDLPKGEGGIIWYWHQAMGEWTYEWLRHYGFDVLHCPAGDAHNDAIVDPSNRNRIVVASISAHGEGKNLQHFHNQYVLQWPRSASRSEQMLGRTHRNGQQADEVMVRTNHTLPWDDMNFAAAINDSLYIHQTTGNRQKLIYASYHPLPVIFSASFLRERGLEVKNLSPDQQAALDSQFSVD